MKYHDNSSKNRITCDHPILPSSILDYVPAANYERKLQQSKIGYLWEFSNDKIYR